MKHEIRYQAIGIIRTPFTTVSGMPIQPPGARGVQGTVEVDARYQDGLKDLDGFSHIILLYHLHDSHGYTLLVKPFLDDREHGLFATRAPRRPNPIGLSVVRLVRVTGPTLEVEDVDMLDESPLLDIKPFVPQFDVPPVDRTGWLSADSDRVSGMRSDDRFEPAS
jgi:tRNA-Thr(GGU) m(6)t(6)A37 methyltransferase TsaA